MACNLMFAFTILQDVIYYGVWCENGDGRQVPSTAQCYRYRGSIILLCTVGTLQSTAITSKIVHLYRCLY